MPVAETFWEGIKKIGCPPVSAAAHKSNNLFFFELNRYRVTPGADIDQAKKNDGQAQRPQHQGIETDFKIIKKISAE